MSENDKSIRIAKAAKELNIGLNTIVEFLGKKGFSIENKPTAKLSEEMHDALLVEFQGDKLHKEEARQITISKLKKEDVSIDEPVVRKSSRDEEPEEILIKNISVPAFEKAAPEEKPKVVEPVAEIIPVPEPVKEVIAPPIVIAEEPKSAEKTPAVGVKVVGQIDLNAFNSKGKAKSKKEEVPKAVVAPEPIKEEKKKEVVVEAPKETVKEVKVEQEVKEIKEEILPAEEKIETPVVAVEEKKEEPIKEEPVIAVPEPAKDETIRARATKLTGPNVLGKIDMSAFEPKKKQPVASSTGYVGDKNKRKRKRTDKGAPVAGQAPAPGTENSNPNPNNTRPAHQRPPGEHNRRPPAGSAPARPVKEELDDKKIQEQIKATLARLSGAGKSGKFAQRTKMRRDKRDAIAHEAEEAMLEKELQSKVLKVTEFVTANELAKMMSVGVTQVISTCMSLGMFVSINQRLDAETLSIVAEEFGYEVEFVSAEVQESIDEDNDTAEDLLPRAPIITVMGHVDHGKTSLLDYIRKANVIAGEAGGITQHIGAYEVLLENDKKICFLDTPGHEAFTAMRARGAKVTDIVIIVIAADDSVMPQTVEAINHALAAGVPIVFAFNKIDKPGANTNKIREELSAMNILVEDWGGKYQCQEVAAKSGLNVDLLLEKVLLEAELLDLKANPAKRAQGTVIEATLDKGRGIVTTILVQSGTLKVGDPILAGCFSGRVKALFNERGNRIEEVGPSTPVQVLGMQGAPQAGDKFNAMESEVDARDIANKRLQLQREQGIRTKKHITLDELGRRLAIGNFKELNVIVKGDVDGSVEALADSLLKLSTNEIQVNVVHKAVGQISESDVLLASASDAIIIGFQVRPSLSARKLAEQEQIDIRMYSIIYDAINEIKSAMEGMLAPEIEEKIVANVEIRDVFKITKVGTIAGCMVLDGKITRNSKIRVVRDGVVMHTGELSSLKRFKDDVKEVATGYECGLNINNFNDMNVGDIIEAYEQVEIKRKLA